MRQQSVHTRGMVTVLIGILILATLGCCFVLSIKGISIAWPFFGSPGETFQASLQRMGIKNGVPVQRMWFPAEEEYQDLYSDTIYLLQTPSDVEPVPLNFVFSVPVDFFGYKYTSVEAREEIASKDSTTLSERFPGSFFASPRARSLDAIHGNALSTFEREQQIVFQPTDHLPGSVLLQPDSLYIFVVNEQSQRTFRARNIPRRCGDSWVMQGEYCDDGNTANGDGCSAECAAERGFRCTGTSSVCRFIDDGLQASSMTSSRSFEWGLARSSGGVSAGGAEREGESSRGSVDGSQSSSSETSTSASWAPHSSIATSQATSVPASIMLHDAWIDKTSGTFHIVYSKNFDVCAHVWKREGPSGQVSNFICLQGERREASCSMLNFSLPLQAGNDIYLCHGNDNALCSNDVTIGSEALP